MGITGVEIKNSLKIRNIYKVNNYNDLKDLISRDSIVYYSLNGCIDCNKFEELYFNEFLLKNDKTIYEFDINDYPKELIKTNPNEIEAVDNYNPNFGNVRNIIINCEVWLCGLDVCEMLGYADALKSLKYHVNEADRKKYPVRSHGQMRKLVFINSHGFYDLCQGSKLHNANQIKDWIKSKFFIAVENNNLHP